MNGTNSPTEFPLPPGYYLATKGDCRPGVIERVGDGIAAPHWRDSNNDRMPFDPRSYGYALTPISATPPAAPAAKFHRGDRVRKIKGSEWQGLVVGEYSTALTPEGYAVESETHKGSVQIYPASALEKASEV